MGIEGQLGLWGKGERLPREETEMIASRCMEEHLLRFITES